MQNISYDLRDRKTKIEQESSLRQINRTLDSLRNNLMGMLWMIQLSLAALQETPNIDQAKNNLEEALRAGKCAKDMMRLVLNSWKPNPVSKTFLGVNQCPGSCYSKSITLPGKMRSTSGNSSTPLA